MQNTIDFTAELKQKPHLLDILKDAIFSTKTEPLDILTHFIDFMSSTDPYVRYEIYMRALAFPKIELGEFVILLEQAIIFGDTSINLTEITSLVESDAFAQKLRTLGIGHHVFSSIYGHLCQCALNADTETAGSEFGRMERLRYFVNSVISNYPKIVTPGKESSIET